MSTIVVIVTVFLALAGGLGLVAFLSYRHVLRRAKAVERGLKMVPVLIHLPPSSADTEGGNRDIREVIREKTAQAEVLYTLIAGTAKGGFKSNFYGQRHLALEIVASEGLVHFYVAIPVALVAVVEQAIQTAYPGAKLEEVEDHNIFSKVGRITTTMGGEITTKYQYVYPINTYKTLERDPLEAMLNTFAKLQKGDGAAVQIMLRPADKNWIKYSAKVAKKKLKSASKAVNESFTPKGIAQAVVMPEHRAEQREKPVEVSGTERAAIEAIEEKAKHIGFEVLVRVVVSTESVAKSQSVLQELANSFALFEAPGLNGFQFMASPNPQSLIDAFIFRFFPPEVNWMILNSVELATLFHLPDAQFTPTTNVERQHSKEVDGPPTMPAQGLLFGYNEFRGKRTEVRLSDSDRRRHTYIIGQTGTGKTTMLENLLVQDMLAGKGFAFIDPHGDGGEKILGLVPKSRAEDVIYFNPADTENPLGLNLFEFTDPAEKDFLIQESLSMLYKIYDPNGQGTIGPRFEQWYRNAALTLMSDPNGSTFIEIPKVFTDTDYLKEKFKYLTDPTVIEFWTKEMGQTSDYHKSEMLGYFVSKFGAFQQNETMRNIMGQTKSAFNLRDIMDQQKILIVNLSKGQIGELNSRLLGMIFVIKFQAAAMSRANTPEADRRDFCLYVDEFQNFSTDSFATILSEARKYRLNLIVANQFIGQLSDEIRDAVFGNVGTIISHRVGPEDAEFMTKQFAPEFDARDLVNIPNFHAVLKLLVGGLPSQPFSMTDLPMVTGSSIELGQAVMQLSAAKYGQPKELVVADIARRLSLGSSSASVAVPAAAPPPPPAQIAATSQPPPSVTPATPMSPSTPATTATPVTAPVMPIPTPLPPPAMVAPVIGSEPAPQPVVAPVMPATVTPLPIAAKLVASSPANPSPSGSEHNTLSIDSIARVGSTASLAMPDAAMTVPATADATKPSPTEVPPPLPVDEASKEAQQEIDELLESSHLAKPARHRLSEAAPELITGEEQTVDPLSEPAPDQPSDASNSPALGSLLGGSFAPIKERMIQPEPQAISQPAPPPISPLEGVNPPISQSPPTVSVDQNEGVALTPIDPAKSLLAKPPDKKPALKSTVDLVPKPLVETNPAATPLVEPETKTAPAPTVTPERLLRPEPRTEAIATPQPIKPPLPDVLSPSMSPAASVAADQNDNVALPSIDPSNSLLAKPPVNIPAPKPTQAEEPEAKTAPAQAQTQPVAVRSKSEPPTQPLPEAAPTISNDFAVPEQQTKTKPEPTMELETKTAPAPVPAPAAIIEPKPEPVITEPVTEEPPEPPIETAKSDAVTPEIPKLAPGEIYVDENGVVYQGSPK